MGSKSESSVRAKNLRSNSTKGRHFASDEGETDHQDKNTKKQQIEGLTSQLEDFTSNLQDALNKGESGLDMSKADPLCAIYALFYSLKESVDRLGDKFDRSTARIDVLEKKLEGQVKINHTNDARLERIEKALRDKQVILTYPQIDTSARDFQEKVRKHLISALGLPSDLVKSIDIFRLGKAASTVLLCCPTSSCKSMLFGLLKKQRDDDNLKDMFLNDFLTPSRLQLFKDARKLKQDDSMGYITSVFSFRGDVFVRIKDVPEKRLIRNTSDIKIIADCIDKTSP